SWYIFSQDFNGATFQATATGESSQLTASCTFTDATIPFIIAPTTATTGQTVTFSTLVQNNTSAVGSIQYTVPPIPAGWTILSGSVTATSNNSTWAAGVVGGGGTTITFVASVANAVPTNGWVRMSFTATAPTTTGNQTWSILTGTNNTNPPTGSPDTSNADGEQVVTTTTPLTQRYCARFVQAAAANAGNTNIKVTSVTGLAVGQAIRIDDTNQEMGVITAVGTPGAGGTGVTLANKLNFAHPNGVTVEAFNIKIDANSSFTNWTYSQNAGSSNP